MEDDKLVLGGIRQKFRRGITTGNASIRSHPNPPNSFPRGGSVSPDVCNNGNVTSGVSSGALDNNEDNATSLSASQDGSGARGTSVIFVKTGAIFVKTGVISVSTGGNSGGSEAFPNCSDPSGGFDAFPSCSATSGGSDIFSGCSDATSGGVDAFSSSTGSISNLSGE